MENQQGGDAGNGLREHFGRLGFVLAAAGSAIGLGNIWKFPYVTYANDGGSFVLIYLLAIFAIGTPLMLAEILVGRHTAKNLVGAFESMGREAKANRLWPLVGWLGLAAGAVILSYYSVVAGWTIHYFLRCIEWSLNGFTDADAAGLGQAFGAFLGDGQSQLTFHAFFMMATVGVVIFGIKRGIERVTKMLMPALFLILVILVVAATQWPGFSDAIRFLFHVGPITWDAVLEAVGHSFFTLSLGMGAMLTYGSYLSRKISVPKAAATVCALDTMIALLACVIMFSIIFSVPEAERAATFSRSATILFTTLPRMFYALPGGVILAPVFYLLVGFAALTSTISLLEVVVAYFVDRRHWSRPKAALSVGSLIFLLGIPSALSLGAVPFFGNVAPFGEHVKGWFSSFDYLASNWLLPVGGLFTALFVAWVVQPKTTLAELEEGHGPVPWFRIWRFALGVLSPLAIIWIIVQVIAGHSFS